MNGFEADGQKKRWQELGMLSLGGKSDAMSKAKSKWQSSKASVATKVARCWRG